MTTVSDLIAVEQLQSVCERHGMKYFMVSGGIGLSADAAKYPAFAENNLLFIAQSVDSALAWLTGVFGGFASQLVDRKPFAPKVVPETPTCS